MGGAPGRAGGVEQRPRRVLTLAVLVVAGVVLWGAAFSAAWRHEHSPVRVILGPTAPVIDRR